MKLNSGAKPGAGDAGDLIPHNLLLTDKNISHNEDSEGLLTWTWDVYWNAFSQLLKCNL